MIFNEKTQGFPAKNIKKHLGFPQTLYLIKLQRWCYAPQGMVNELTGTHSDSSLHPSRLPQGVDWWYTNSLKVFDMFAICLINLVENM